MVKICLWRFRNFIYKIYHSNEKPLIEEIKEQIDLIESIGLPNPVQKDNESPPETSWIFLLLQINL